MESWTYALPSSRVVVHRSSFTSSPSKATPIDNHDNSSDNGAMDTSNDNGESKGVDSKRASSSIIPKKAKASTPYTTAAASLSSSSSSWLSAPLARLINDHHYNNQLELFIPSSSATAIATESLLSSLVSRSGHYRVTCQIVDMFTPEFITQFIARGMVLSWTMYFIKNVAIDRHIYIGLIALSVATPVDHCNTIAIANGNPIMTLLIAYMRNEAMQ